MKKVLSIVLSIAMVLCMMPAMAFAGTATAQVDAAYSDTEGTACEGAVNVLSALGVVNGYSDGTYKPEQVVTRAEMAKLIITALGVADYASATTSKFTDMGAASWAIPYVEYASNLNIVNGYGYGLFGPNDTVTYEQAVTMIVRALGYTDKCNEMNGSWPAVYVQKATALGLFENVVNGGSKGADRGDVAIMLYNALDCAEVYPDNDGATQYKTGNTTTNFEGQVVSGVTMLGTLNASGTVAYGVVTKSNADNAVSDIYGLIGAAGKIVKNKDNKVIAVGDLQGSFITGEYNASTKKFTVDKVEYTIASDAYSKYANAKTTSVAGVPYFVNNGLDSESKTLAAVQVADKGTYTLAAKIDGTTITNIYSIAKWTDKIAKKVSAGDVNKIKSSQQLLGYDLPLDNSGDIDTDAFILEGVDSLDAIAEDNIVAVYTENNGGSTDITKVAVGTEVVAGKVTKVKADTDYASVEYTVDGTVYKSSKWTGSDGKLAQARVDSGTLGATNEITSVSSEVTLYLDASGKIYTLEDTESGYLYGVCLKEAAGDGTYAADYKIKIYTADASSVTYTIKNKDTYDSKVDSDLKTDSSAVGTLVKYKINSDGKITEATNASVAIGNGYKYNNGVFAGKICADDMVVFTYSGADTIPAKAKKDNYSVEKASSITEKLTANAPSYSTAKGELKAILVPDVATNATNLFGLINSKTKTQNDSDEDVYELTGFVNGEVLDAMTKDNGAYVTDPFTLVHITKTGEEISVSEAATLNPSATVVADNDVLWNTKKNVVMYQNGAPDFNYTGSSLAGYCVTKVGSNSIEVGGLNQVIMGATVYSVSLTSSKKFDAWTLGSESDITAGDYVVLLQVDKNSSSWDTVLYISAKDAADSGTNVITTAAYTAAAASVAAHTANATEYATVGINLASDFAVEVTAAEANAIATAASKTTPADVKDAIAAVVDADKAAVEAANDLTISVTSAGADLNEFKNAAKNLYTIANATSAAGTSSMAGSSPAVDDTCPVTITSDRVASITKTVTVKVVD